VTEGRVVGLGGGGVADRVAFNKKTSFEDERRRGRLRRGGE